MVRRIVCRMLGDCADAADCFQEVFLAAWKFSGKTVVANWSSLLKKLATTKAIDGLRNRIRRRIFVPFDPADETHGRAGRQTDPAGQFQAGELAQRLRLAIADLPPSQAEVFCLRHLEDLTYDQIADELGLTTNAVGVLLNKARRRLCKTMETSVV